MQASMREKEYGKKSLKGNEVLGDQIIEKIKLSYQLEVCGLENSVSTAIWFLGGVSSKEEVDVPDSFCIQPIALKHIFEEDGKIYDYQRLKITIGVSSISFHAYAEITFWSTSDGGKGDYRSEIYSPDLLSRKGRYCSKTPPMGTTVILTAFGNLGLLMERNYRTFSHRRIDANSVLNKVINVIRVVVGTMLVRHLCSPLVPLVLILVDGSNPIDITDPRWEILLIVQKKIDLQGDSQLRLLDTCIASLPARRLRPSSSRDCVRADVTGKDSGAAEKRVIEFPTDYDQEMSFVMFRCTNGEASKIEMDENQTNQEQQLKGLVEERMKEIKLIAAHIRELEEEVNLLENLSHPNIIRYLGTTREEASLNILLEIVPGGSITSLLGKFGSFPEFVIRMYTKQLLLGVEYLHKNGIMHRDIKGANILVDNKGCIKLADFGESKKVVELATVIGAKSMKGTPYWMAPEVILQTGHSFSVDIWSVGCTVIEMATGKPHWSQQHQEVAALLHIVITKSYPPIPEHLSAEAIDFLLKCLQKEPNLRPAASELLQHPFVTREYQETYLLLLASVMESSGKKMATPEMELKNSMDLVIITTYMRLEDVHNSVRCSTIYPEKFPGSVPHWGSGNCDDDMCQIDDEDDLVIKASANFNPMSEPDDNWLYKSDDTSEKFPGSVPHWGSGNCDDDMCQIDDEDDLVIEASAKFDSALLYDDFNKSFNPMSEPDDNWPCKSGDTPELESRVNLFSGQTVNKATDIPRAFGKGNNDFTFPCGPLVAEDDDDDDDDDDDERFVAAIWVDYSGSGNCDDDMCQIDDEDDLLIGASTMFDSALLSDDFNKPDDNWPCKSDDTPELESRVNLFSGQTVNKSADIPRALGKGNNDFTFSCGPLVAKDDDDEVVVAKYGLGRRGGIREGWG
ncbi:unnamed protein product [Camellia sinensis]